VAYTVGTTVLPSFAGQRDSRQNHLNGSAYALRGYGVTLGSSSSHDPFFSRKAAFLLDTMAALPRKMGQRRRADPTLANNRANARMCIGLPTHIPRLIKSNP
jgi:hypothetical protein